MNLGKKYPAAGSFEEWREDPVPSLPFDGGLRLGGCVEGAQQMGTGQGWTDNSQPSTTINRKP